MIFYLIWFDLIYSEFMKHITIPLDPSIISSCQSKSNWQRQDVWLSFESFHTFGWNFIMKIDFSEHDSNVAQINLLDDFMECHSIAFFSSHESSNGYFWCPFWTLLIWQIFVVFIRQRYILLIIIKLDHTKIKSDMTQYVNILCHLLLLLWFSHQFGPVEVQLNLWNQLKPDSEKMLSSDKFVNKATDNRLRWNYKH